jgi:hypothetical protein
VPAHRRAAPAGTRDLPAWWVAVAALVLGAGIAASGVLLKRHREPAPSPPSGIELAVEAELQEIIAEARAREARPLEDPARTD